MPQDTTTRVLVDQAPFATRAETPYPWDGAGAWPCHWIACPGALPPFVAAFALPFAVEQPITVRIHVSADERYRLFLDGQPIGRGPERGDPAAWYFESYDLVLPAGRHVLAAQVWALGELAPFAQFSLRPGFLLCPDDEALAARLATGRAPWVAKLLPGYRFLSPHPVVAGTGGRIELDGRMPGWDFVSGTGEGWAPAAPLAPGYSAGYRNHLMPQDQRLVPAVLPAQVDAVFSGGTVRHVSQPAPGRTCVQRLAAGEHLAHEAAGWQALLDGTAPYAVPPHTRRRIVIDLGAYLCTYPEITVSGGRDASLRLSLQESLFADVKTWARSRRDAVDEQYFALRESDADGVGDRYRFDGGDHRSYAPLWWLAGRFVELLVETADSPLTIERISFQETRFPLEDHSQFAASDPRLAQTIPIMVRALQMCAHESYMDCPFYEQLQYAGDTRLECLVTYVVVGDDRLARKALTTFNRAGEPGGFVQSRYPSRQRQMIAPFGLWWASAVHDYLFWRGDEAFVRSLMPGVRGVLDAFTNLCGADGMVRSPRHWNYIDWVPAWDLGVPPGGAPGEVCAPLNWQYVYALQRVGEIEALLGEVELAQRNRRLAHATAAALADRYWDARRGLFADDAAHTIFTEHSQCLAVLSGVLDDERRDAIARNLFAARDLTSPTVYFMHYFFETCRELGRMDVFLDRMRFWFDMAELDFKTTYESGDPATTRSDCHAWGAHPLYHYFASLLGIRPAAPGFAAVEVRPQLGGLDSAEGVLPHPAGEIRLEVRAAGGLLAGRLSLPDGVPGMLEVNGRRHAVAGQVAF